MCPARELYKMYRPRNNTRQIKVKDLLIGGGAPVSVQSMTNVPLSDVPATVAQIERLAEKGAALVRCAVRTVDEVSCLKEVLACVTVPVCADIHFDYRIALGAIRAGVHKVRINPGNIGSEDRVREVVAAARDAGVPIRIGVNGGSIDRKKFSAPTPDALVDSAMGHVRILENLNFYNIAISIKSSNLIDMIEANRIFSGERDYPLHIGLTEAGYGRFGLVQSSVAIGHLLLNGIGDTLRVSLTGDPCDEIDAGCDILKSIGDIDYGIKIISCPTCGRTDPDIDLRSIAEKIDNELNARFGAECTARKKLITVAVMGCEVNGPGEAAHADAGIAGARSGNFLLFSGGTRIRKIASGDAAKALADEIEKLFE